jgi:hypothetical protein
LPSIVDVAAGTALSLEAVQTPSKEMLHSRKQNQVSHYVSIIKKQMPTLKGHGEVPGGGRIFYEA